MPIHFSTSRVAGIALAATIFVLTAQAVFAATYNIDGIMVSTVAVNGGQDTTSPGTTCIKVSVPLVAACPGGWVAIQNNNKQLIAAALAAKTTSSKVAFMYDDAAGPFHCPGRVFTPCSVNTIEIQ